MLDISSPQAHLAPSLFVSKQPSRTQSLPTDVDDDPFYCVPQSQSLSSPPTLRLLSPYRLPEDAGHRKLSKPPCSPTKRRKGLARNLSRSTRHRHCARPDCCITTFSRPLTSLDDLPWISALSIEPDCTNPWDIADLSILSSPAQVEQSRGPGPVRRRKTSLRSDPLAHPRPRDDGISSHVDAPFTRRALFTQSDLAPQTPRRKTFAPFDIVFRGINPIFPSDIEESRACDIDPSL